ncbi:gas vesicle protein [Actinomadura sp. 21ATH]|uniref:gas vesicle protein n=1 Tax=Actinomadura sp. 21ATH TaxID=1735444 RepID=UPI0035C02450
MSETSRTGDGSPARAAAGGPPAAAPAGPPEPAPGKGIVIAGDIRISPLDIELLAIRLRLLSSPGGRPGKLNGWWEHDPALSSRARQSEAVSASPFPEQALLEENRRLRDRVNALGNRH